MRGRTKRHSRRGQRTTRRRQAANRTTTHTQADAGPTLGDVTNHNREWAMLMFSAMELGKQPRCAPAVASRLEADLHEEYGLKIDDPLLHLAVATGWRLLQDEQQRCQAAALVEWWERVLHEIPNDGSLPTRVLLNELRPGLAAVTAVVASAASQGLPLARDHVAIAVAAAAVVTVLRGISGRPRDWQMTARVLEYYGLKLGTQRLRQKGDALRKLVRRRTQPAT